MRLLSILTVLLLLVACTKHREIKIIGRNAVTGQGYDGLAYKVVSSKTGNYGEVYRTEATGNLDANGEAFVSIKQRKGRSYSLRVFEPSNNCYTNEVIQSFDSPYDVNGTFTFEFAECAYMKLHVHNLNCIDSNDEIKFRRLWLSTNESNDFVIQSGCFQFDGDYFSLPIGNYKYEWYVTKNGVTTFHDSIFTLSANQYFDFTINY